MKTRRITIDWQKLINKDYSLFKDMTYDILHVYAWLLTISKNVTKSAEWNIYGFHKTFFDYCHNNNPSASINLGNEWRKKIYNGLINILCKTNHDEFIKEFLQKQNIVLGKRRVIKIEESEEDNQYYYKLSGREAIDHITTEYLGLELKKEFCHPDYLDRTHPRIISHPSVSCSPNTGLFYVEIFFDFLKFNYQPSSWSIIISQKPHEPLKSFFNRAIQELDNMLVPSNNCNNCPFWKKALSNNSGDYLRHGYRGYCLHMNYKCLKPNVVKYNWQREGSEIIHNSINEIFYYPYYVKGKLFKEEESCQ